MGDRIGTGAHEYRSRHTFYQAALMDFSEMKCLSSVEQYKAHHLPSPDFTD